MRGRSSEFHSTKPLVVRGGLVRTFGSLAGFLAVMFFFAGLYMLENAIANPPAAGSGEVLTAAFLLALAVILLFYLIRPRNRRRSRPVALAVHAPSSARSSRSIPPRDHALPQPSEQRRDLPFQRVYVDRGHVRS